MKQCFWVCKLIFSVLKVRKGNNLDFEIFEYLISQFYELKTLKGTGGTIREG